MNKNWHSPFYPVRPSYGKATSSAGVNKGYPVSGFGQSVDRPSRKCWVLLPAPPLPRGPWPYVVYCPKNCGRGSLPDIPDNVQSTWLAGGRCSLGTSWQLEEGSISDSPNKIRELFAIMLVFCQVGDPIKLWEKHRDSLAEDVRRQMERELGDAQLVLDIVYNQCLILLEDIVISMSGKTLLQFGLPPPSWDQGAIVVNREYPVSYTHLSLIHI